MQGTVLAGRYRLDRQLGQGGMGSVWLAEHLMLRSHVAVKLMDPAIAATPEGAERFRREAQAAASLRSTHIVQVLDYGVDEVGPFLVMELLQGETLADRLARHGRLAPERTVSLLVQVARAVGRAHAAKIIHRDLKPDNIFLVREDDQEVVKVLDFGIAKIAHTQLVGLKTRSGMTMGTLHYMSPEQAEGKSAIDHRSDLWAIAVIACECITGARPFDGETFGEVILKICVRPIPVPSSLAPVPAGFDAWFAKATERDAGARFQSAAEMVDALRDALAADQGAAAHAPTSLAPTLDAAAADKEAAAKADDGRADEGDERRAAAPARAGRGLLIVSFGAFFVLGALGAAGSLMRGGGAPRNGNATARATEAPPPGSLGMSDPAASPVVALAPLDSTAVAAPPPGGAASPAHAATITPSSLPSLGASPPNVPSTSFPREPRGVPPSAPSPSPPGTAIMSCYTDPFTGKVRPVTGAPLPSNAELYACSQNAFTGAYQRR
jgi:serine/threonine-protein kinase